MAAPAPTALGAPRQWLPLVLALAVVIAAPILLRPAAERIRADDTLVIITPHNEAIRHEFAHGFAEAYHARTGRRVEIDWRTPGGTSEIARFLDNEYLAAFRSFWQRQPGRAWNATVQRAYVDGKVQLPPNAANDTPEQAARRAFLASTVGCGIDLFFGGGAFDYQQQARAGRLVDGELQRQHPEWFGPGGIPQTQGGEVYWDTEGRWYGTCLDAFGICYNEDALRRLGMVEPPRRWADLADPRLFRQVALANPTQSGSIAKAFEMLIQQQMQEAATAAGGPSPAALEEGWARAMRLLLAISANARYFTDSSGKVSMDVGAGEAAAGMTIGLYGRFQSEALRTMAGSQRLQYVNAEGGTSFGADPIGLLRGAPHPELAREFMAWVLSLQGQRLWNWQRGQAGGPQQYALRRLPIIPALYAPELQHFRSDPEVNPYAAAHQFAYQEKWTGSLFRTISFIVRVACIEPHQELVEAMEAIRQSPHPEAARAELFRTEAISYTEAQNRLRTGLADKLTEVQLAKELSAHFRAQYRRARELARE